MFNLVERFMNNLSKEQVNEFALKKGAHFSESELDFTYDFIKKNWRSVISNPNLLNLDRYQSVYNPQNFSKLKQVFNEYSQKYQKFL